MRLPDAAIRRNPRSVALGNLAIDELAEKAIAIQIGVSHLNDTQVVIYTRSDAASRRQQSVLAHRSWINLAGSSAAPRLPGQVRDEGSVAGVGGATMVLHGGLFAP